MQTRQVPLIAFTWVFLAILVGIAPAADGESASANLESSRLRILEPIGIFEPGPVPVQEVEVGELVQLQFSYPSSPPFPKHVGTKVADRALTALWIADTDGKVVALTPGQPQEGLIGVRHFSVYLRANTAGESSAEVTVTLSDEAKRTIPVKFAIRESNRPRGAVKIKRILNVEYAIEKSNPPNLLVTATGEVPTAGWHDPVLVRRIYVRPPEDGIWEYDLYAVPPAGVAAQVISQVQAYNRWSDYDQAFVKGVRVFGEGEGVMEKRFGEESPGVQSPEGGIDVPKAFAHVHVRKIPLNAADTLADGPQGEPIGLEDNTILVWVDAMPSARFAHPTQYVLITGKKAKVVPGKWWPVLNGEKILHGTAPDYTVHLPFPFASHPHTARPRIMAYPLTLGQDDKLTDGVEGEPIKIGEPMAFLWIDLEPNAKFAHPTLHILMSRDQAQVVEGQWFPMMNGSRILYGSR